MASPMAADRDDGDAGQRATRWVGRSVPRVEDAALLTGRGRYIDDLGVRPGTLQAAILRSPHAHAEIEAIDCQAARAADGVFAVLTGADIAALTASLVVGDQGADRLLAHRHGSRALCRRAGRRRRRLRPLPRRGCARPDRGPLSPVAGGRRPAGRRDTGCAAAASARAKQRRRRARVPLWRSRGRVRRGRAPHPRRCALSAQFLHADRDLWRHRRIRRGGGRLRRPRQFPGAVQPAPGHGAGAEGARQPLAAAHAAGLPAAASASSRRSFPTSC